MKPASSDVSTKAAGADAVASLPPSWLSRDWLWGLLLVLAVVLTYQPVWYAGFIWDDPLLVTANPCIVGPLGLKEIWTTGAAHICPITLTTFWVEHALWGVAPLPYHLVNVLMHGVSAVLFWRVLRSLQVPGAWLGAALWALHPVEVESVAWISEMKNTESGLFFLLSILFFVRWLRVGDLNERTRSGWNWNYGLILFFAALAMAGKSSTVILPAVLCLCAWWVEGRWHWRNLARVVPLMVMSLAASALSLWMQKRNLATSPNPQWVRTWPERLATAGDAVWFYLGKLVWPHPLITIYPRWQIDAGWWVSYLPLLAVIIVLFILWLKRESWSRSGFFVFAYFLTALLPVLGLVDHFILRYSLVFDHFQYLASMGPLALAGAGMVKFATWVIPNKPRLQSALCSGLLLVFGMLSWQRVWAYQSMETLWSDTLAKNPNCWMGYNGLGDALLQKGQVDKAMAQYQKALEINPNYAEAHNNLGNALLQKGQMDAAMAQFHRALEIDPNYADAHYNLGNALSQKGQVDEAIAQYQEALACNPNDVEAHNNLGNALLQKGELDKAIEQCQLALTFNPDSVEAHNNLGTAFLQKGQLDAAIEQGQEVLEINPNSVLAHNNLGYALLQKGEVDQAIEQSQQVLKIDPNNVEARYNLGNALLQKGQMNEAIEQYQKALALNPNMTQVHINLGNALLQKGRMDEAIAQYKRVLVINPDSVAAHCNLGMALTQKGELDEAMVQLQKALALNPNMTQVHDNLGAALLQKGRAGEATAQFQEALQLNPADATAQKNLAKVRAMVRKEPGSQ